MSDKKYTAKQVEDAMILWQNSGKPLSDILASMPTTKERLILSFDDIDSIEDAICNRLDKETTVQSPVVPTIDDDVAILRHLKSVGYESEVGMNDIIKLARALQATPPPSNSEKVREAVEEIEEARMVVLDSMEKQSTVKVILACLDQALAALESKP